MADLNQEMQAFADQLSRLGLNLQSVNSSLGGFGSSVKSSGASVGQGLVRLRSDIDRGRIGYRDATAELRRLERQFENLDDAVKRSAAGSNMVAMQQKMSAQLLGQGVGQAVSEMGKLGVASAFDYFKNQLITAANSLQQNVGGVQMAFNLQNQALQDQAKILGGFGDAAAGAAASLALVPGGQTLAGIFAAGAVALKGWEFVTNNTADALKILQTEISKTDAAFKLMTGAGVVFTNGMTGIRNAAGNVGLDLKDFSELVGKNSDALGKLGGSVNQGIARFTAVSNEMRGFRQGLINLGYSVEDQAKLTIDYMGILQRSGQLEGKTAQDVARDTNAYLTNLRAITAFTGEDAKKAMQRGAEAARQLAVQEKLSRMDEKAQARFRAGIENMPDFMKKGLSQSFLGAITDPETAQALAQVPAYGELLRRTTEDINNSALTEKEITENYQRNLKELGGAIKEQSVGLGSSVGVATALGGSLGGLTQILEGISDEGRKGINAQKQGAAVTTETTEAAKNTTDALTQSVSAAQVAFRDMSALLTQDLTPALNQFAKEGLNGIFGFSKAVKGLAEQVQEGGMLVRKTISAATGLVDLLTPGLVRERGVRARPELRPEGTTPVVPGGGRTEEIPAGTLGRADTRDIGTQLASAIRENNRTTPARSARMPTTSTLLADLGERIQRVPTNILTSDDFTSLRNDVKGLQNRPEQPQTVQLAAADVNALKPEINTEPVALSSDFTNSFNNQFRDNFVQAMATFQTQKVAAGSTESVTGKDLSTSVTTAFQEVFSGPGSINQVLASLQTTLESDKQKQIAALEKQNEKLEALIATMQDNTEYTRRMANELA